MERSQPCRSGYTHRCRPLFSKYILRQTTPKLTRGIKHDIEIITFHLTLITFSMKNIVESASFAMSQEETHHPKQISEIDNVITNDARKAE